MALSLNYIKTSIKQEWYSYGPSLSDLPNHRMKGILNVFPIYPQDASQTCSIVTSGLTCAYNGLFLTCQITYL